MAKLAEAGVTAVAWHTPHSVFYEELEQQEQEQQQQQHHGTVDAEHEEDQSSSRTSVSGWRSARAIARQARRFAAAATAHRDSGGPNAAVTAASPAADTSATAAWAYRSSQEEALSFGPSRDATNSTDNHAGSAAGLDDLPMVTAASSLTMTTEHSSEPERVIPRGVAGVEVWSAEGDRSEGRSS